MRVIVFLLALLFMASSAEAEVRHTFYERYDPSSSSFVYDDTGATTTGNVVSVFTYDIKSIHISSELIGSTQLTWRVEGRVVGELDTWSVLTSGHMGTASGDAVNNVVVEISELVDYLRVGLRVFGDGTDAINVRGVFRK